MCSMVEKGNFQGTSSYTNAGKIGLGKILNRNLLRYSINGKINLADIFTKEMKDTTHFVELHDLFMCPRLAG